jgi:hypothetical protein
MDDEDERPLAAIGTCSGASSLVVLDVVAAAHRWSGPSSMAAA